MRVSPAVQLTWLDVTLDISDAALQNLRQPLVITMIGRTIQLIEAIEWLWHWQQP
jgi:hypothetical protein